MKKYYIIATAFVALLASTAPAYCWDKYGHMLIAEVAYENLTPAAKTQIDAILTTLARDPHVDGLEDKYSLTMQSPCPPGWTTCG